MAQAASDLEGQRYPVGRFEHDPQPTPYKRSMWITSIDALPAAMRDAVAGLSEDQLDTPYREGGWTVRQLVHHVADSHLNAYVRFKWTLTEDSPTIKAYNQDAWAALADSELTPVEVSLDLLDAIHRRWGVLIESLKDEDWTRPLVHPENGPMTLDRMLQLYAWHGRHHTAHIAGFRKRENV